MLATTPIYFNGFSLAFTGSIWTFEERFKFHLEVGFRDPQGSLRWSYDRMYNYLVVVQE